VLAFARRLREARAVRVLDLGCGLGRHTVYLAGLGFQVWGLDASEEAVSETAAAVRACGLRAVVGVGDVCRLPYPDGYFDGVLAFAVLSHNPLPEIRTSIDEIRRVCGHGALCLLTFGSTEDRKFGLGRRVSPRTFLAERGVEEGVLHRFFDRGEILALLAGLRVLEMKHHFVFHRGGTHASWFVTCLKPTEGEV